jgi:hypothetical protein
MTPQERQLLIEMFQRIDKAGDQPRDAEAEALIQDAVRQLPFAPYLLSQTVLVQEQALKAANARIEELQAKVSALENPPSSGSFLGAGPATSVPTSVPRAGAPASPWGPNAREAMAGQSAPQFQQAPQAQAQPMAAPAQTPFGSGGFLQGALSTAAGVAGGMLLANSIRGLFEGNHNNNHLGIANSQSTNIWGGGEDSAPLPSADNTPDMSDIFPASHSSSGDSYDSGGSYDSGSYDSGSDTSDV